MTSTRSLTTIAQESHYYDQAHLCHDFQTIAGMTPREYRAQCGDRSGFRANLYNSAVDVPNWGAQIPGSLETARRDFGIRTPGAFFRAASPLSQALSVLVLIVSWRLGGATRGLAALALGLGLLADVLTFACFYPRNAVIFVQTVDIDAMTRSWTGWSRMNHVRNLVVLGGLVCQRSLLWRVARAT